MSFKTITAAAATAAALLLTGCSVPAGEPATETTAAAIPCETEDYSGPLACYWNASERGNGQGRSFTWDGSTITYTTSK